MAHDVFFEVPKKQLFGGPIKIIVNRDTTGRKNTPKDKQEQGRFGELVVSQGGIGWFKSGARRKPGKKSKGGSHLGWRKFAKLMEKHAKSS